MRRPLRLELIVPSLLAVILLPASLVALVQPPAPAWPLLVLVGTLFVALHALSFLASTRPLATFAAASAIMLLLALLPLVTGVGAVLYPSGLVYLLCLHQVAARCERRYAVGALAVAVTGSAIVAITTVAITGVEAAAPELTDPLLRLGMFFGLAAANAAAWAFGLLQWVRRTQAMEHEQARLREVLVAERARIAAELHDVVAHSLTVMVAQAEVARGFLHEDPSVSDRALGVVVDSGREALRGLRTIVRDDAVEGGAAPRAPIPDGDALAALIDAARSPETRIELTEGHGTGDALSAQVLLALLPFVREGLTNSIRHTAPPRTVHVRLDGHPTSLKLTIEDDGGSGPSGAGIGAGTGLIGLAERARLLGGSLESGAISSGGWRLCVSLPLSDAGVATELREVTP